MPQQVSNNSLEAGLAAQVSGLFSRLLETRWSASGENPAGLARPAAFSASQNKDEAEVREEADL